MNDNLVKVLFPLFLPEPLTYCGLDDIELKKGDFVKANLGNKQVVGVVWQTQVKPQGDYRIKPVLQKLNIPPLSDNLRKFIDWVANYTLSGNGMVLKMAMSSPKALEDEKLIKAYELCKPSDEGIKVSKHGMKVISLLDEHSKPLTANEISEKAIVGKSVIKTLLDKNVIRQVLIEPKRDIPNISKLDVTLSTSQQTAADHLCEKVSEQKYSTTLLDGVTGSGKTEVYFAAIEEALKIEGSQILIMLPEIALTTQIVHRFEQKFGFAPTQWHSGLTPTRKEKNWRDISQGRARLIIGARSALFLPYTNLRAIIVDEEHDSSYKQEEGVIYHARDMAVVRASIEKCPIILASATPSIETVENVRAGKYSILKLDSRFGEAVMPDIKIVDMTLFSKTSLKNQLPE